jgi:hypothetical protein
MRSILKVFLLNSQMAPNRGKSSAQDFGLVGEAPLAQSINRRYGMNPLRMTGAQSKIDRRTTGLSEHLYFFRSFSKVIVPLLWQAAACVQSTPAAAAAPAQRRSLGNNPNPTPRKEFARRGNP